MNVPQRPKLLQLLLNYLIRLFHIYNKRIRLCFHVVFNSMATFIETLGTSSSSSNCKLRVVQRTYLKKHFVALLPKLKLYQMTHKKLTELNFNNHLIYMTRVKVYSVQRESLIAYAIRRDIFTSK